MENQTPRASDPATSDESARRRRARRGRLLHLGLSGVSAIVRALPLRAARTAGRTLGRLAWHVARRERRIALQNIARAFPEWSEQRRRTAIRNMFLHLGTSLFEILWLPNVDATVIARTTTLEGWDRLLPLLDSGRGIVVVTGHCGNWEWLAYVVASFGKPVTVLQRERNETELNQFITATRARVGIRTIDRGSAAAGRELIQAIRRGGILAFLVDQNIRTPSVKVPFFGTPALTPIGPAKLAIRSGAVVVTAFIERLADGTQRIHFGVPEETKRDDDPVALTARWTRDIEEQIRRVPEQWVWMHERWRERPKWDIESETIER